MPMSRFLKQLVDQGGLLKVIEKAKGTPTKEYGMENSSEWNYFQQQVDDYRAGRSAYRGQRTTEGSPTFGLSDEEYKESSGKHYSGLQDQINANRPEGIGEFGLSTRVGRDDPSLINYNPSRTKAYSFSREGRMEEIGEDRISDYPDVQQETTANISSELVGQFSPAAQAIGNAAFKGQGGIKGLFAKGIEKGIGMGLFKRV
jgi:hypothetical protein